MRYSVTYRGYKQSGGVISLPTTPPLATSLSHLFFKEICPIDGGNYIQQLLRTINLLSFDEYNQKNKLLSNSSIGEHTRHIIELFQHLIQGYESGLINYDDRKRDMRLQQDIDFASKVIAHIICDIDKPNKLLHISTIYNTKENKF